MDIVIDNIIFSLQKHGGISVVWVELLKRMLVDSDFNLKFLEFNGQNELVKQLNIPIETIISNNLSKYPLKIQRYLNPNVNMSNGIFHSSYLRTTTNRNALNVTTIHDFTYEYYFNGLPKFLHHFQKTNAVRNSNRIICVSNNTKQDLLKIYPWVNESNIVVVHNGVSELYKPLNSNEINLNKLVPYQTKEFVLFVGDRRSDYKNFKMTVRACNLSKYALVIVGGGALTETEIQLLNKYMGKGNYSQLLGLSNQALNQLYNSAAYLIYPSIYEGFGIPILEAQNAGCPVICSNTSSIPEVAGNAAYIIENISAEKIAEVINELKSRSNNSLELAQAGFRNAKRFSWDECYAKTKEVYVDLYK